MVFPRSYLAAANHGNPNVASGKQKSLMGAWRGWGILMQLIEIAYKLKSRN
jgi:hypothetical protein